MIGDMGIMGSCVLQRAVTSEGRQIAILRNYFNLCQLLKSLLSACHIQIWLRLNKHSSTLKWITELSHRDFVENSDFCFGSQFTQCFHSQFTSKWILFLLSWCHFLWSRPAVSLSVLQCSPNTAGRSRSGRRTCTEWLWRWTQHQQQQGATCTYFIPQFKRSKVIQDTHSSWIFLLLFIHRYWPNFRSFSSLAAPFSVISGFDWTVSWS